MKKIIIFIILFLMMVSSAILFFIYSRPTKQNTNVLTNNANNINQNLNIPINVNANINLNLSNANSNATLSFANDLCNQVSDVTEKQKCLDTSYYDWSRAIDKQALKNSDVKLCDLIIEKFEIESCIARIAAKMKDASLCSNLEIKDTCLIPVYSAKDDFSACASIKDLSAQDSCIKQLLSAKSDTFCNTLPDTKNKTLCLDTWYFMEATRTNGYDLCKKISTQEGAKKCLNALPADSDKDGISDFMESNQVFTDPNSPDTDSDNLTDKEELFQYHTSPLKKDTDQDGFDDGVEVKSGHDPLK